jgi:voltage-gated potassium channel
MKPIIKPIIKPITEKNHFIYLTIGIVILLFVSAMVSQFPWLRGYQLVQAFSVLNLAIGIYGFRTSHMFFHTGIGLTIGVAVIVIFGSFMEELHLYYLHLILLFGFYLWAIWLAGKQVLFTGPIDNNKIVGAICIYLLIGLIWSIMYLFISQAIPGAFTGVKQLVWHENFADVAYYSFVTLATLGYGDIAPVAPLARFLAYMEALVGVFYMAILVASLVGTGISQSSKYKQ